MRALEMRGALLAERTAASRRAAVAAAADAVPGVAARVAGDSVVIEGRDLIARWVEDARLRYVGSHRE